jgi:hypothetical protein
MSDSIVFIAPAPFTVALVTLPQPPHRSLVAATPLSIPRPLTAVSSGTGVGQIAATPIGLP